ncbi:unnamed protein product [Arabis nemorensis]|uniref:SOSEKI DIX-like domain-containing protein n=1 Tax=Arabis nemorensis TaxID=586526 RepID=A0A565CDC7_9BRAS|nr:unnamed protein product [Arabis nemorensis]
MALIRSREARTTQENQLDSKRSGERKVPVVYYLCRKNGQLDHPHFIEVSLSSSHHGLYLRDVINRLNDLRGKGMACLYSWSTKRSYKNGFVWHDLSEDDLIFPVHGQEYVLKGSEILYLDSNSGKESDFPTVVTRRRNQSWSSIDYKVYRVSESTAESTRELAADASTQTDDLRRKKKPTTEKEEKPPVNEITELSREEMISPPPQDSDSSPETLETLMNSDGRLILIPEDQESNRTVESLSSGKMRASAVLMHLISCGAMSFKKCGPTIMNGRSECTVRRGTGNYRLERAEKELRSFGRVKLEEKEYFSGSLIDESKKERVPALKRSSSYNTRRSSRMGLKPEISKVCDDGR